jgi:fluoroacetyl-CoA thioesterase
VTDLGPHLGSRHAWRTVVTAAHTVPALPIADAGLDAMPPVLATPMLVAMAECACAAHLATLLDPAPLSLGTEVTVSHTAATPVGLTLTITTELVAAEGRRLTFAFEAHDGVETAGHGRHTRAIVARDRFAQLLAEKRSRLP